MAEIFERIVLIDGNQRSGTNLLLHLLEGHSKLRVLPQETALYSEIYKPDNASTLKRICELHDFDKLREVTKNHWFFRSYSEFAKKGLIPPPKGTFGKSYKFKFSMAEFYERLRDALDEISLWTRGVICREILECFWETWAGKQREDSLIVAKNHEAGLWLPEIVQESPGIKIIHLIRNPLDVVCSQKSRYSRIGKWSFKRVVKEVRKYDLMKRNIRNSQGSVLPLRYEDLVQKKEISLMQVCNFLNIVPEEEAFKILTIAGEPWHSNSSYNPDTNHIKRKEYVSTYKQSYTLSIKEYSFVLKHLESHIRYWGYDVDCISPLRYAWGKILSRMRKRGNLPRLFM